MVPDQGLSDKFPQTLNATMAVKATMAERGPSGDWGRWCKTRQLLSGSAPRYTAFLGYLPNGLMNPDKILARWVSDHYLFCNIPTFITKKQNLRVLPLTRNVKKYEVAR